MNEYVAILKKVPLFSQITDNELITLLKCLSVQVKEFKANEYVFSEGEKTNQVGIVLAGRIQLVREDFYGNRSIVTSVGEAELFGEAFACADISQIPISAVAQPETKVMFIDYRKILTSCSSCCGFHQQLIFNMLRIVSRKNVYLNQKIDVMSKRTTRDKLLAYLSYEAKKKGKRSFSIDFNRQELADYLYVDRSAMSNELCKLRDEGVLSFNKNNFELLVEDDNS